MAFFIMPVRASIAMTNKNGESGSPCLRPREQTISIVGDPFTNTEALAEWGVAMTHLRHFTGKFI
ncbi:hypothetical protein HanIR_Chr11g0544051 [Helianthus annuus]|nr:hypothetical protein HanIR_Chr11g0544051 [Helianthus annuus]